ncbi:MAG: DUF1127 domain-containing protein [Rhodospirillales bacterium]
MSAAPRTPMFAQFSASRPATPKTEPCTMCAMTADAHPADNLCHVSHDVRPRGANPPRGTNLLWAAAAVLRVWFARASQRRALHELDARLLDDIGVSREAAARESIKHFWQM